MPSATISVAALALALAACAAPVAEPIGSPPAPGPDASGAEPGPGPDPSAPPSASCPELAPAGPSVALDFDHLTSGRFGEARHALHEPVVGLGEPFTLTARFRYGLASKDLEDEEVVAYVRLDPCDEWTELGSQRTDDDGMIEMTIDPALFADFGAYEVEIVVLGDLSRARGHVYVVPSGQPSVVFDIDGTLTISDSELLAELYDGVPAQMYEGGPDVAWLYAEAGYFVVYLSGRPHMLQDMSRRWLEERGFPEGPVITGDHLLEATGPLVVRHKREHLEDLVGRAGLTIPYAYGNATTDVCAYAEAGIDPGSTYIIGDNGGAACDGYDPTVAIESYPAHASAMGAPPPAW